MQETAQYFEKRFFINRSKVFIAFSKFYATHGNYEIFKNHKPLPQQSCFFSEDMQTIRTTFSQLLNEDSMKHIDYKTFNSIQVFLWAGPSN